MKFTSLTVFALALSFAPTSLVHAAPPMRAAKRAVEERYREVTRKLGLSDQGQNSVVFGGPTSGTLMLEGTLGFSNLPRLGVHYGVSDLFSIGGAFTFNLGYYNFLAITPSIQFSAPLTFTFARDKLVGGFKLEPGIAIAFDANATVPAFILDLEANVGGRVGDIAKIGGGLNIPFALLVVSNGVQTAAIALIPILFGPAFEIAPIPELGIHVDAKFGPLISTVGSVAFGMRLGIGATYSF